jgi:hypothetical protein
VSLEVIHLSVKIGLVFRLPLVVIVTAAKRQYGVSAFPSGSSHSEVARFQVYRNLNKRDVGTIVEEWVGVKSHG